ncbi:DUF2079 domain-containing protein [Streptococcus sp. zg-JUN1979]|uniref:DUF2079 domain-containing protein n=1 Tax=Streptococcus sp. zg-JUN1979 TaxID=3391450 RepID=UPI0039A57E64
MNFTSETLSGQSRETLSRLSRSYQVGERRNHDRNFRVPTSHRFYLLLLSAVVSLLSVAVPLFTHYANSVQSENLYIGMMMVRGQLPYSDVFATGGFAYYLLILVSYLLGSTFWLVPIQMLFFYTAGVYFYKIIYYVSDRRDITLAFTLIFYVLNIVFGFGGLYPSQFGMPFVLIAIWFLVRYFAGMVKDEAFIIYGIMGAFALLFDPQSVVFWLLSFVFIAIYNIRHKHFARGFYQLLCIIFGTSLIIYTAGFFIFNLQILSSYIKQAFIYPFTTPVMGNDNIILSFALQLAVSLGSGILAGLLGIFKRQDIRVISILLGLTSVVYTLLALFSGDYCLYHLLPLTMYGLILTASQFRRRRAQRTGMSDIVLTYVKRGFYLPVLLVIFALGHSAYRLVMMTSPNQERVTIGAYLSKETTNEDTIYVWDKTAAIYSHSQRRTSSQFALPEVNTHSQDHKQTLIDNLLEDKTAYIVVKNKMTIPAEITNLLKKDYKKVSVSGVRDFTLYQKK